MEYQVTPPALDQPVMFETTIKGNYSYISTSWDALGGLMDEYLVPFITKECNKQLTSNGANMSVHRKSFHRVLYNGRKAYIALFIQK